jgi:ABC-type multidrug transport system permease subunit
MYAVTKGIIDSLFVIPLVVIFGSATSLYAPLAIIPLLLGCLYLGSLALAITAHIHEIDHFNLFFAIFFSTIFLCGAWFPISSLWKWLQIVAYILPTTSVIDLTRAFLNGGFETGHIIQGLYLVIVSLVLIEWALRSIRRRMVV